MFLFVVFGRTSSSSYDHFFKFYFVFQILQSKFVIAALNAYSVTSSMKGQLITFFVNAPFMWNYSIDHFLCSVNKL